MSDSTPTGRLVGRRHLLQGGAALGGAAAVTGMAAVWSQDRAGAHPSNSPQPTPEPHLAAGPAVVAFYGARQAGVETPPPAHASFIGADLTEVRDRDGLIRLLRLLSDDAARLTQGRAALADLEHEVATAPQSLTVTVGLGPAVLKLLGGAAAASGLRPLPAFPQIDELESRWGQTDLLLQVRSDDPMTLAHARLQLIKDLRTLARPRWIQNGFRGGPLTPAGTGRNLMGQVDGTVNPVFGSDDFARQVWIGDDAPGPTDATMMVLRRIRMKLDTWERVDRVSREFAVGRRLSDGSPLTGHRETDPVLLDATDAQGFPVIDLGAHVRRAHATNADERFLRAPYNYLDENPDGTTEAGLLFAAYAADLTTQFVPVQQRLAELDRLNTWITPVGSAVYLIVPGCAPGGFVGDTLIGAL